MPIVPIDDLQPGPIRRDSLPPDLRLRIKLINRVLYDVMSEPLQETLEHYQRDANPGPQVTEMEKVAVAYLEFCMARDLTPARKRDAFRVLIGLSLGGTTPDSNLSLTGAEVRHLQELFRTAIPTVGSVDTPPPWSSASRR